jgi:chaperonin GroES
MLFSALQKAKHSSQDFDFVVKKYTFLFSEDLLMTAAIKPLYDRVLVQRLENEQTTAGGIIIPDTAQEKTQIGAVIATGEGKLMNDGSIRALKVKKGDKIIFGKYSGTEIKLENKDYLILREDELLGIVEK